MLIDFTFNYRHASLVTFFYITKNMHDRVCCLRFVFSALAHGFMPWEICAAVATGECWPSTNIFTQGRRTASEDSILNTCIHLVVDMGGILWRHIPESIFTLPCQQTDDVHLVIQVRKGALLDNLLHNSNSAFKKNWTGESFHYEICREHDKCRADVCVQERRQGFK